MEKFKRINATFRNPYNRSTFAVDMDNRSFPGEGEGFTIPEWLEKIEAVKNLSLLKPAIYYVSYFVVMDVLQDTVNPK